MVETALIPDLSALFSHFAAEALLCAAIPIILVVDLFTKRDKQQMVAFLGTAFLALAFAAALIQPASSSVILTKALRADGLAKVFRIVAIGTGLLAAIAALRGNDVRSGRLEFFVCLLGAVVGACLTAAANDLIMLYLAIETLSICGYLLAGFKKDDPKGAEAAVKYVIFGAVASGAMLYGLTLMYGFAGTATIASYEPGVASLQAVAGKASASPLFLVSSVLVFAGLAYKIAVAPFQFWCPDVYEGSPTSVAAFLAVASKGAGIAAALRLIAAMTGGGRDFTQALAEHNEAFRGLLLILGVATMTIANAVALRQRDSKRILAYSAIAHAGVLLLGIAVTTPSGASAVVFYMVTYLFMTFGAFYLVALLEREMGGRTDLDAFNGLGYRAPALAACMTIFLLGLTGLPPTSGFPAKFFVYREVFAYAGASGSKLFFWGGIIGLANTVVALGYYSRFIRAMYLADRDQVPQGELAVAGVDTGLTLALSVPVLVLGLFFGGLYDIAVGFSRGVF
jgi:NADH-quinone oxidoreductase subunit N